MLETLDARFEMIDIAMLDFNVVVVIDAELELQDSLENTKEQPPTSLRSEYGVINRTGLVDFSFVFMNEYNN